MVPLRVFLEANVIIKDRLSFYLLFFLWWQNWSRRFLRWGARVWYLCVQVFVQLGKLVGVLHFSLPAAVSLVEGQRLLVKNSRWLVAVGRTELEILMDWTQTERQTGRERKTGVSMWFCKIWINRVSVFTHCGVSSQGAEAASCWETKARIEPH